MSSLIEEEYETFNRDRLWKQVFERTRNEATILNTNTIKDAKLPENRDRNRYRDVSPYDSTRVRLEDCDNDYINASVVQVPIARRVYILTQGPLANTAGHFWLMVWQQNSKGVIMLNKIIEEGRLKCHPYFPAGVDSGGVDSMEFSDVSLRVDFLKQENFHFFITRYLKIVHLETGEEKIVLQFHYIAWPDFGIPKSSESFLTFLYAVRHSGVIPSTNSLTACGPPVIHCSAGIGRSGTFCLVDSALVLVERTRSLSSLDIRPMLLDMRQYRSGLIQTAEQLQFSYMAILDGAKAMLQSVGNAPDHTENGHLTYQLNDLPPVSDEDDDDDEDDENSVECTNDGYQTGLNVEDNKENIPEPPVRTSSKEPQINPIDVINQYESSGGAEQLEPSDIPPTPKRISSLPKASSVSCSEPPPVPPRPSLDRQQSAPAVPSISQQDKDVLGSITGEAENTNQNTNQLKRKRDEARDEKKKKTKELVDSMRAKQKSAEQWAETKAWLSSKAVWIGAAVAVVVSVSIVYYKLYH